MKTYPFETIVISIFGRKLGKLMSGNPLSQIFETWVEENVSSEIFKEVLFLRGKWAILCMQFGILEPTQIISCDKFFVLIVAYLNAIYASVKQYMLHVFAINSMPFIFFGMYVSVQLAKMREYFK